ncbi:MAG: helix-turn-helix domain-containing protein, partial [Cyclobacteriaceae bacterium]|nr:helix-turn-helix domain-containing protein [Cyclobacteriaceae bacterium]
DGLKDKKGRGRKTLLSKDQLTRIRSLVLKETPTDHGFNAEKWTGPLLTQWIKQEYQIEYKKAQIYNLLKKIGIIFKKKEGLVENN